MRKPTFENPKRRTLTKALHTVTVVSRVAFYLIQSDKFTVRSPEAAVRKALEVIGHRSDWRDSDLVFAKCVEATQALLDKPQAAQS